jgi:hypothetical protein
MRNLYAVARHSFSSDENEKNQKAHFTDDVCLMEWSVEVKNVTIIFLTHLEICGLLLTQRKCVNT